MSPRRRQGAVLIAGAVLLYVLVEIDDLEFHWTPLLIGLAYLAAAAAGGRSGSYWATACVGAGWGAGVVLLAERDVGVTAEAGYLLAAGTGALAGALLEGGGYAIDALGLAAAVVLAGAIYALEPRVEAMGRASTFAAALAVVGLVRLASPERGAAAGGRPRSRSR